jgi:molybdate transport system ATP-binding protein
MAEVRVGQSSDALVALQTDAGRLLARVARRSLQRLNITPGIRLHAIIKTVSIAPSDGGAA